MNHTFGGQTCLGNDHRQGIDIGAVVTNCIPDFRAPAVAEKFWSDVTDPEIVVGDRGVDKVSGPSDKESEETEARNEGTTHRINEDVRL